MRRRFWDSFMFREVRIFFRRVFMGLLCFGVLIRLVIEVFMGFFILGLLW